MQVDHVVGVSVGDHDRIDPVAGRRAELGEQSGQGPVAEVEDDPRARVLQEVAAAGPAGFRPGAAAAKGDESTVHSLAGSGDWSGRLRQLLAGRGDAQQVVPAGDLAPVAAVLGSEPVLGGVDRAPALPRHDVDAA